MIETVLGKAAMYLNARIPEIQSVSVSSSKELDDFEDVIDEYTGEVVFRFVHILLCCVMVYPIFNKVLIIQNNIIRCKRDSQYIILVSSSSSIYNFHGKKREDKRSPDFNGDRETMEYQGLDPDARGPFVLSSGGGGSMIRPA